VYARIISRRALYASGRASTAARDCQCHVAESLPVICQHSQCFWLQLGASWLTQQGWLHQPQPAEYPAYLTMSGLKSYLAEKYMSGPKADAILARAGPQKKKKRKANQATPVDSGAIIRDEDGGWGAESKQEEDDTTEAVVASDRGFKKRRIAPAEGSGWATLQEGIKQESPPPADDEQPMVVDDAPPRKPLAGGLMSASQLRKALPQAQDNTTATEEEISRAQETVYRDATGRKIDTKAARAEAARLKREREEKEAQKMEWGKGLVQKEEQEKRRLELEKQKGRSFARYADDADLNEDLKAKELWNDPAAAFLTVSLIFSVVLRCINTLVSLYRRRKRKVPGNLNIRDLHLHRTGLASSLATDGMVLVRSSIIFCDVFHLTHTSNRQGQWI
jgi:pre-mRNA-splicing factor CWC26